MTDQAGAQRNSASFETEKANFSVPKFHWIRKRQSFEWEKVPDTVAGYVKKKEILKKELTQSDRIFQSTRVGQKSWLQSDIIYACFNIFPPSDKNRAKKNEKFVDRTVILM